MGGPKRKIDCAAAGPGVAGPGARGGGEEVQVAACHLNPFPALVPPVGLGAPQATTTADGPPSGRKSS